MTLNIFHLERRHFNKGFHVARVGGRDGWWDYVDVVTWMCVYLSGNLFTFMKIWILNRQYPFLDGVFLHEDKSLFRHEAFGRVFQ